MGTAEEQARVIIARFEAETVERIRQASEEGKKEILDFVAKYVASLQIELPLSVKQVLDRGGQVRQVQLSGDPQRDWNNVSIDIRQERGGEARQERFGLPSPNGVRITLLVEPV